MSCEADRDVIPNSNVGMRLLDMEWITYLNSDDIVYRDAYSRLMKLGNRKRADVVYGHSDFIDWDGRFKYSFMAAHQYDQFKTSFLMIFITPTAPYSAWTSRFNSSWKTVIAAEGSNDAGVRIRVRVK